MSRPGNNNIKTVRTVHKVVASLNNAVLPQGLDCLWTRLLIAIPNGAGLHLSISHLGVSCFNVDCMCQYSEMACVVGDIMGYVWDIRLRLRDGICCVRDVMRYFKFIIRDGKCCVEDMMSCVWNGMLTVLDVMCSGRVPDQPARGSPQLAAHCWPCQALIIAHKTGN